MENGFTIFKDFGLVPCGQKNIDTLKIDNTSKTTQVFSVECDQKKTQSDNERLHIHPDHTAVRAGQSARFTLTYLSHLENIIDNFHCNVLEGEKLVARFNVRAQTEGPDLSPTVHNLKFFYFRNTHQPMKHVEIVNAGKCEAKFFFDLDEDYQHLEISQTQGVIPSGLKLGLKFIFKPSEPGVYYKRIFCIVQFHKPIIFNILGVCKPKLKLEPKKLKFRFPPEERFSDSYDAYMARMKSVRIPEGEKCPLFSKTAEEYDLPTNEGEEAEGVQKCWSVPLDTISQLESPQSSDHVTDEIHLTARFIDIKNSAEVPRATTLINLSKTQLYYFEWDHGKVFAGSSGRHLRFLEEFSNSNPFYDRLWFRKDREQQPSVDPKNHFRVDPCKGFLQPNARTHFSIYFTPSVLDFLYHIEVDVKVFPCNNESNNTPLQIIDLPITISLRINDDEIAKLTVLQRFSSYARRPRDIIRHQQLQSPFLPSRDAHRTFGQNPRCGWVPQCKISQRTLHLRSCVPDELVYGTFVVERQGHLPVNFAVLPPKDPNYTIQPPLGYLSKNFQLFVVQFSSESKEEGVYTEHLKIKFNTSSSNCQTIKLVTSVEMPKLIFGRDNSLTFTPIVPGSKASAFVPIENPTNLHISYEFVTPDDITWAEVVTPKGLIEPKAFGQVEVVFKPETPCEYLDYIPCHISSISKPDCTQTILLQLTGSCQFGYLVATPNSHDFGESVYLQEKSINIHLFNFSPSLLHFRLTTVHRAFPVGEPEKDVIITPNRGSVPAKSSLEVKVTVIPHNVDILQYAIVCQNLGDDSEEASPREEPRKIFLLRFEGVKATIQIRDVNVIGGGPLFSPHWIWKMLNIDRINKALKSTSSSEEISIKFPLAVAGSKPLVLVMVLANNGHGEVICRVRQEVLCSCLEASDVNVAEPMQCKHASAPNVFPTEMRLGANEVVVSRVSLKHTSLHECLYEWVFELPHNKCLILKASSWSLPSLNTPLISTYLSVNFRLKPVFIGDPHPPLQLFWLYNNTRQPSSYVVENVTLWEPAALLQPAQQILTCINPNGVIPPISSAPLRFLFKPTEIKSYSAEVRLTANASGSVLVLHVTGEGVPTLQQVKEFIIPKTIPKNPILHNVEADVECCENCINIPFLRIFSRIERIFFLRNHSISDAWSFRWHSFRADDVLCTEIIPGEGVIEPGSSAMMTLVMKTFSCATFISISVPCDVINYSKLVAYESSVRYREIMTEKAKDYFTITEKGISYEEPNILIKEKPEPAHIFLTVNAHIVSSLNIDAKLSQKQQSILNAENEIAPPRDAETILKPSVLPSLQQVMENLLWNVLVSSNVEENIRRLEKTQDYNYLQILPESKKKSEERLKRFHTLPKKNQVQRFLENAMKEMLHRNFSAEKDGHTKTSV